MASSQFPPDQVREVVAEVASLLKERKESISVAETVRRDRNCLYDVHTRAFRLTPRTRQAAGGIISAALLSTPGASGFYKGGLTVRVAFLTLGIAWLTPFPVTSSTPLNPASFLRAGHLKP